MCEVSDVLHSIKDKVYMMPHWNKEKQSSLEGREWKNFVFCDWEISPKKHTFHHVIAFSSLLLVLEIFNLNNIPFISS